MMIGMRLRDEMCKIEKGLHVLIWITGSIILIVLGILLYASYSTSKTALKIKEFNQMFVIVRYEK
jgi:hypothetical protein